MSKPRVRRKDVTEKPQPAGSQSAAMLDDGCWWLEGQDNPRHVAGKIRMTLERTWRNQEQTRAEMATSWRIYENTPIAGLTPRMYRPKVNATKLARVAWNLIKSVGDTYVALIVKETPKVSFVTTGGNRTLQKKASLTEKFVDGVLYDNNFRGRTDHDTVRSSFLFPFGSVNVYADWDNPKKPRIKIDRVMPWELHVGEQDAAYGDPRNPQWASWVDKRVLAAEYPMHAADIMRANSDSFMGAAADPHPNGAGSTMCLLIQSWHLPRIPGKDGSGDGRHVLSVGDTVLLDEPWTRNDCGIVRLYRQRPVMGIWAQSGAMELAPVQVEIARTLHNASLAMKRAVGHVFVENNSEVNTNAIDDRVMSIIRYTGTKPEFQAFQAMSPETLEYLNLQWQRGHEMFGISTNMSAGETPARFESGEAQKVYADFQQKRFMPCYREYQQWYVELARTILAVAKEISDEFPDFEVRAVGNKAMMKAVRYLDAHLEAEEFSLELEPTSKIADDPAARLDYVQNATNAGFMSKPTAERLLEQPDTKQYNSYEFAPYDYVAISIDSILDEGKFEPPDPEAIGDYMPDAVSYCQKAYAKAVIDDVDPKRRMLVLKWRDVLKSYLEPPAPPPPMPGASPPPGQPGVPGEGPPMPGAPPGMPPGPPGAPNIPAMVAERQAKEQAAQTAGAMGG